MLSNTRLLSQPQHEAMATPSYLPVSHCLSTLPTSWGAALTVRESSTSAPRSREAATDAREGFIAQFARGAVPDDIPEHHFSTDDQGYPIANLLKDAGLCSSTSEAMRMIQQGAVKIDGDKVSDKSLRITCGTEGVFQVGKRKFARIRLA